MLGLQQSNLCLKIHVFGTAQETQQHQTVLSAIYIAKGRKFLASAKIKIHKFPILRNVQRYPGERIDYLLECSSAHCASVISDLDGDVYHAYDECDRAH